MAFRTLRNSLANFFKEPGQVPPFKIAISIAYLALFAATLFIPDIRQQNHITVHGWFATGSPALVIVMYALTVLFLTRRGVLYDRRAGKFEVLEERDARHEKVEVWSNTEERIDIDSRDDGPEQKG